MSWVDKALREHKLQKQIEKAMNTPEYKEAQRKQEEQEVLNALGRFVFMMCGFLETRHGYKAEGLKKFLAFVKVSLQCTEDNELFFKDYDAYFKYEYGLDVLGELGLGLESNSEEEKNGSKIE